MSEFLHNCISVVVRDGNVPGTVQMEERAKGGPKLYKVWWGGEMIGQKRWNALLCDKYFAALQSTTINTNHCDC